MKLDLKLSRELEYLSKVELHLSRVCRKLDSDSLSKRRFDDLYNRLAHISGEIDDALEYWKDRL